MFFSILNCFGSKKQKYAESAKTQYYGQLYKLQHVDKFNPVAWDEINFNYSSFSFEPEAPRVVSVGTTKLGTMTITSGWYTSYSRTVNAGIIKLHDKQKSPDEYIFNLYETKAYIVAAKELLELKNIDKALYCLETVEQNLQELKNLLSHCKMCDPKDVEIADLFASLLLPENIFVEIKSYRDNFTQYSQSSIFKGTSELDKLVNSFPMQIFEILNFTSIEYLFDTDKMTVSTERNNEYKISVNEQLHDDDLPIKRLGLSLT
jgi:hypothetical protein